jgi:hypothetical protein
MSNRRINLGGHGGRHDKIVGRDHRRRRGDLRARRIDGCELVEQLHVAPGRDIDIARAGADHLIIVDARPFQNGGDRGKAETTGKARDFKRCRIELAQLQRPPGGGQIGERLDRMKIAGAKVRSGDQPES